jgi:hypothetical protein
MKNKLENEMLDDIAFDFGKEHEWIDQSGNWKSEEDKKKAYALAGLEAKKYKKGGEIKSGVVHIYYVITGYHDLF